MRELLRHRDAFNFYYSLGKKRNFNLVARKFNVSEMSIARWSKAFSWQERIVQRDKELADKLTAKTNRSIIETKEWYRDLIRKQIEQYAENLKLGEVRLKEPSDFSRLIKLDQLLIGEPTEKVAIELTPEQRTAVLENLSTIKKEKE